MHHYKRHLLCDSTPLIRMISKRLTTLLSFFFFGSALSAHAVEAAEHHEAGPVVSQKAYILFELWGLPVTNAMCMGWLITLLLLLVVRLSVRNPQLIPGKAQMLLEALIDFIRNLIEPIVGERMVKPTLPFLLGLFVFVLIHNWSGLIPGVGAFGFYNEEGHLIYWMRPMNSDMNTTLALGLIGATVGWLYYVLRYAGIKALLFDIFGNKADASDMPKFLYFGLIPVFLAVGVIELFSILLRNVSLSVRLYGNIYGGETLITTLNQKFPIGLQLPFYGLETLIGFVQALVFTLLCAVYIGLICNHGDGEAAHH